MTVIERGVKDSSDSDRGEAGKVKSVENGGVRILNGVCMAFVRMVEKGDGDKKW